MIAYYESQIQFKQQAIKELLEKGDIKSQQLLEKEVDINIQRITNSEEIYDNFTKKVEQSHLLGEQIINSVGIESKHHEDGVCVPKTVWDSVVKMITEKDSFRQFNFSLLPENFDHTLR